MRALYSSLTASEQRAVRWSGAAAAVALWLAAAWADPRFLVAVPLISGAYVVWLKRSRSRPQADDDWDL